MTFMRLYVTVAPSLHGRPGSRRAALGRAGRDETQTRGPGRADNMRHSVARHPGPGHGTHGPLWTLRSETIVRRGASALLPVCWGPGTDCCDSRWKFETFETLVNDYVKLPPRPVCPCFLCDYCDGDLNSAPAPLLRLPRPLCCKAGTCGAFVERGEDCDLWCPAQRGKWLGSETDGSDEMWFKHSSYQQTCLEYQL